MATGTIERTAARALRAALPVLLLYGATALADRNEEADHETARRLVAGGEIRPLADILSAARAQGAGPVLETGLEREHGRWIYELDVLQDGVVWEYVFDAATGTLLTREPD